MVIKIRLKTYIGTLKPVNWIKGSFMVLFGILHTRFGIGVGRITNNIYFGLPIYFLVVISGMLIVWAIRNSNRAIEENKTYVKKIGIVAFIFYFVALGLSIFHTVLYNLSFLNVLILVSTGIIWILTFRYGLNWNKKGLLMNILISFSFSFGIIYGAALNTLIFPGLIFLFFFGIFSLQISKDIISDSKRIKENENETFMYIPVSIEIQKAHKISMLSEILAILFLIISIFLNLINKTFYLFFILPSVSIIAIAAILHLFMSIEKTYYRIIKILLRFGMFFAFTALLLGSA
jgi:4-hydroxybenzoate polyprenyltransferase